MPFFLLLLLTVACLPVPWPAPPTNLGLWGSVAITWGSVGLLAASVYALAEWTRRQLVRDPSLRLTVLRRQGAWRFYHLIAMLASFGLNLYIFGWGWVAQGGWMAETGLSEPWPGAEIFVLSPFLASLLLGWTFFYDLEKALHFSLPDVDQLPRFWSRRAYVAFHLRNHLALVIVPVLLMIFVNDLPHIFPQEDGGRTENFAVLITLAAAILVFTGMPMVVRILLGLRSLPRGELRDRLEIASQRLRFRCTDILLWNTRSGIANAMVVGLLPVLRYVVLTDRLVQDLTPDEVEAVFGHEVGHVKHRHMIYYLGFLFVSLGVLSQVWEAANLEELLNLRSRKDLAILPLVGLLGAYIFLVFGFVSRRCERQADVYGCRAVSCRDPECSGHDADITLASDARGLCPTGIRVFISALEKVAYLNGISRDKPGWLQSWQHSTIARRVEFLQRVLADPLVEIQFQRRVGLVKWALFLSMAGLCLFFTIGGWSLLWAR